MQTQQRSFEEVSVFSSEVSSGGALWKSELLFAEWVAPEINGGVVVQHRPQVQP